MSLTQLSHPLCTVLRRSNTLALFATSDTRERLSQAQRMEDTVQSLSPAPGFTRRMLGSTFAHQTYFSPCAEEEFVFRRPCDGLVG